jgi:hypothetical protein
MLSKKSAVFAKFARSLARSLLCFNFPLFGKRSLDVNAQYVVITSFRDDYYRGTR